MDDSTLGERGVELVTSLLDAVRARPLALLGALVAVGSLASAVPAVYNAVTFRGMSFDYRVLSASGAFGVGVQVGLVVATILMLIDRLTSNSGRSFMFVALAAIGAAAVVTNLGSLVIAVKTASSSVYVGSHVGEGRVSLALLYLAPALLGGLVCWISLAGSRLASASSERL